jgi:hypothetical protein
MVTVPCSVEELVAKPQDENVLDHLLTEVVVNTENLLLLPVGVQSLLQVSGALKVLAERLLDDDPSQAILGVTVALQLLRNDGENTRGQCHVEDAVLLLALPILLDIHDVLLQVDERVILVVLAGHICAQLAELL